MRSDPPSAGSSSHRGRSALFVLASAFAGLVLLAFDRYIQISWPALGRALFDNGWTFPPIALLLRDAGHGVGAAFLILVLVETGRALLDALGTDADPGWERLGFSFALGAGAAGYAGLALAAAGFSHRPPLIGALAIAGAAAAWIHRGAWTADRSALASDLRAILSRRSARLLLLFLALLFALDIIMAFVPEVFYDALAYHLAVPHAYLVEGGLVPNTNLLASLPQTIQMVYLFGLAVGGDTATKLVHVGFLAASVALLIAFGRRQGRPTAGLLAAALYVALPTVQLNVWTSGIDAAVPLFALAAVQAAFAAAARPTGKAFGRSFLSAVFVGLAVASKYTAALIFPLAAIAAAQRPGATFRHTIRAAVAAGAIAIALLLPWWIKNAAQTGNPFYPFALLAHGPWSRQPARFAEWVAEAAGARPSTWRDWAALPWSLSIRDRTSQSFQGPLMLALVPVAAIGLWRWGDRRVVGLAIGTVAMMAIGLWITTYTRYLLPIVAVACGVLAIGVADATRGALARRSAVAALIAVGLALQSVWILIKVHTAFAPFDVLVGRISPVAYEVESHLRRLCPFSAAPIFSFLESHPDGGRVLFVGDEKSYPLSVPLETAGVFDEGLLASAVRSAKTPRDIADRLKSAGITRLLVNAGEARRLAPYGLFDWPPAADRLFDGFWSDFTVMERATHVVIAPDTSNDLYVVRLAKGTGETAPNVIGEIIRERRAAGGAR